MKNIEEKNDFAFHVSIPRFLNRLEEYLNLEQIQSRDELYKIDSNIEFQELQRRIKHLEVKYRMFQEQFNDFDRIDILREIEQYKKHIALKTKFSDSSIFFNLSNEEAQEVLTALENLMSLKNIRNRLPGINTLKSEPVLLEHVLKIIIK